MKIIQYLKLAYRNYKYCRTRYQNEFLLEKCRVIKEVQDFSVISQMPCVFILSTGRAGTMLLTDLLNISNKTFVQHSPQPELAHQSYIAYKNSYDVETMKASFLSARLDILGKVSCTDLLYIETNNRISLYAEAISELFPSSKFIHLIRHPAEFVRSGMRRGYYESIPSENSGHLIPRKSDPIYQHWSGMHRLEKITWQWETINREIVNRTKSISSERIINVKSGDMYNNFQEIHRIFDFIGLDRLPDRVIKNKIAKPVNKQKEGSYPKYDKWSRHDKDSLEKFACSAKEYGFEL